MGVLGSSLVIVGGEMNASSSVEVFDGQKWVEAEGAETEVKRERARAVFGSWESMGEKCKAE